MFAGLCRCQSPRSPNLPRHFSRSECVSASPTSRCPDLSFSHFHHLRVAHCKHPLLCCHLCCCCCCCEQVTTLLEEQDQELRPPTRPGNPTPTPRDGTLTPKRSTPTGRPTSHQFETTAGTSLSLAELPQSLKEPTSRPYASSHRMPVLPRSSIRDSISIPTIDAPSLQDAAHQSLHALSQSAQHIKRTILPRQSGGTTIAIPQQYAGLNSGPAPGAVAGIVLGSVAGFLLIIWLLWIASSGSGFIRATNLTEEDVVVRRRDRSRGTRRSHARTEMTSRSPRRERIVRQERIIRDHVPVPREPSRIRETVYETQIPERRVEGDDIVEVIEEHSSIGVPPPKRKSRKSSGGYR